MLKTYRVEQAFIHENQGHEPGATLRMSEAQALFLCRAGLIAEIKPDPKSKTPQPTKDTPA